jgi:hypothetical protein
MIPQKVTEEEKTAELSLTLKKEKEQQELADAVGKSIGERSGSDSKEFGWLIYHQLSKSCYANNTNAEFLETFKNISIEMEGIAPKDQIEGMLAAQMVATHHAAMDCYRIAAKSQMIDTKNLVFNSANKLVRSYAMQMEALNRYRGKGQQKMTVEHVHINSGGQAIIGNVTKNNTSIEGVNQRGVTLENEQ